MYKITKAKIFPGKSVRFNKHDVKEDGRKIVLKRTQEGVALAIKRETQVLRAKLENEIEILRYRLSLRDYDVYTLYYSTDKGVNISTRELISSAGCIPGIETLSKRRLKHLRKRLLCMWIRRLEKVKNMKIIP